MLIGKDLSLNHYSTMKVGGKARYLIEIEQVSQLSKALEFARNQQLPWTIIGHGSNTLWKDVGFNGVVLVMRAKGMHINPLAKTISCSAGQAWDDVVSASVDCGFSGLELLSGIPGTAGAAPVQNIGAYGRELSDRLLYLYAYDTLTGKNVRFSNRACQFGLRSSRFKNRDAGRYIITSLTLQLSGTAESAPFYPSLANYIKQKSLYKPTSKELRCYVLALRQSLLPDPESFANCGSFFLNPVVGSQRFTELAARFPGIVGWQQPDGKAKLAAAWLIEQSGFPRGYADKARHVALWQNQALVIGHSEPTSCNDILEFAHTIQQAVRQTFGLRLQLEPTVQTSGKRRTVKHIV